MILSFPPFFFTVFSLLNVEYNALYGLAYKTGHLMTWTITMK